MIADSHASCAARDIFWLMSNSLRNNSTRHVSNREGHGIQPCRIAQPPTFAARLKVVPSPAPCDFRGRPPKKAVFVFVFVCLLVLPALARTKYQQPGPIHLDGNGQKWAEKTLRKLSVEEKVGQLFMPGCEPSS